MNEKKELLDGIIKILMRLDEKKGRQISSTSLILSELDFDSIKMLELAEELKHDYDFDVFVPPNSIDDLRTAETLACAVLKMRAKDK